MLNLISVCEAKEVVHDPSVIPSTSLRFVTQDDIPKPFHPNDVRFNGDHRTVAISYNGTEYIAIDMLKDSNQAIYVESVKVVGSLELFT